MLPLLGIMAGLVINAIKLASQNSGDYLKMMEQSKKIKALEMAHKYEVLQIHGLFDGNI
jgi:ABC-type enterochelin transport system permease subunit